MAKHPGMYIAWPALRIAQGKTVITPHWRSSRQAKRRPPGSGMQQCQIGVGMKMDIGDPPAFARRGLQPYSIAAMGDMTRGQPPAVIGDGKGGAGGGTLAAHIDLDRRPKWSGRLGRPDVAGWRQRRGQAWAAGAITPAHQGADDPIQYRQHGDKIGNPVHDKGGNRKLAGDRSGIDGRHR